MSEEHREDLKPERKRFKLFQLRWKEALGKPECPYAYRYVLNFGLFAIRLHHWIRSDDKRYMHDHPYWFWTLVLKGHYVDVSHNAEFDKPDTLFASETNIEHMKAGILRFRPAKHKHYVEVVIPNTWTLLLTGPAKRDWGFWVDGKLKRPMKYFHKYGHPACDES